MEIGQKFNKLTLKEYFFYIDNHKKYTDFNILGLYRSITENEKLEIDDKIQLRDYAHQFFKKSFDFLQLKDPQTYFKVSTLGEDLIWFDKEQIWNTIRENQQQILSDKKIKHRNFGNYSKHNCGTCILDGIMIRQGSILTEDCLWFKSDKRNQYTAKDKSDQRKAARKNRKQIIDKLLDNE